MPSRYLASAGTPVNYNCYYVQAGFDKMEVTGRFELPEELLQLERSGILEAEAFDSTRSRSFYQPPNRPASALGASHSAYLNGSSLR